MSILLHRFRPRPRPQQDRSRVSFAKLRQFLRAEEEARLEALEQEESKKTGLLTERINRLTWRHDFSL